MTSRSIHHAAGHHAVVATGAAHRRLREPVKADAERLAGAACRAPNPHSTVEHLVRAVAEDIGTASRRSVYDAVDVLVEIGLIRRIQPAGSPARYEDRVGDNHHHLICRSCGALVDVDCVTRSVPCLEPADAAGYAIDEAEVTYWGRCPSCLELDHRGDSIRPTSTESTTTGGQRRV